MSRRSIHKAQKKKDSILPKILILAGIALIIAVILLVKNQGSQASLPTGISAEAQLDQYLADGKPTFVFFHSNNCQSCLDMIAVVEQVYPEFKDQVALVDVNVYDSANQSLLQRAKINTIPTQLFIDASGQSMVTLGVMTVENLRQQLQTLAEGAK